MKHKINELKELLEQQQASDLVKYKDYYEGRHDILSNYPKNTGKRSNNIEVHNFCKLFIDNNTGYLLGNPISFNYLKETRVGDTTIVDLYTDTLGHNIRQIDQKLMQYQQIYGYTFELNYINTKGEFAVDIISPLEMAVERSGKKVVHGLYEREVTQDYGIYDYFDIKSNKIFTIKIKGEVIKVIDIKHNPVNNPIIVISNNWEQVSEIEPIKSLNDSYNTISSDLANEISDNRNSYMIIEEAKINEEILSKMNQSGIITVPKGAEVKFLTKDINDSFVQNKLEELKSGLYNLAGQVDFNDSSIGSNTSSLALRNKLTNLNNKLSLKEGFIREAINIRLRNFKTFLETEKEGLDEELMDTKAIDIVIVKNIPTSNLEVAEMVTKLYEAGLLSRETATHQLSFISDTKEEIRKIEEDRVQNASTDLENTYKARLGEMLDEGI